jgi:hypothetical protein
MEHKPERARIEPAHEGDVALELRAVAPLLTVEERVHVRAFVHASHVVNDPARAARVNEGAVDRDTYRGPQGQPRISGTPVRRRAAKKSTEGRFLEG